MIPFSNIRAVRLTPLLEDGLIDYDAEPPRTVAAGRYAVEFWDSEGRYGVVGVPQPTVSVPTYPLNPIREETDGEDPQPVHP